MALSDLVPWRQRLSSPFESMRSFIEPMGRVFGERPKLDVEETPKEIVVKARLPGFERGDVTVDVTENSLTIRGCRSQSRESRRHGGVKREESSSSFVRYLALPSSIKTAEVRASFKDGLLQVDLPRVKETPVRRVDIG